MIVETLYNNTKWRMLSYIYMHIISVLDAWYDTQRKYLIKIATKNPPPKPPKPMLLLYVCTRYMYMYVHLFMAMFFKTSYGKLLKL